MDIFETLSTKFIEFDIGTLLSKVAGAFENQELDAIVVTVDDIDEPVGIITKTDVIEALTWECEDRNAVQVFGLDLLER